MVSTIPSLVSPHHCLDSSYRTMGLSLGVKAYGTMASQPAPISLISSVGFSDNGLEGATIVIPSTKSEEDRFARLCTSCPHEKIIRRENNRSFKLVGLVTDARYYITNKQFFRHYHDTTI